MNWNHSADVLVVGSGNGALSTALCNYEMGTKDVMIMEKTDQYGGSSSIGGGGVWIPCNRYAKQAGAEDTPEDAMTYLNNTIPEGTVEQSMLRVYLENGPKMIQFLHDRTHVRYHSLAVYPDYFSDVDGARLGHRSLEPEPLDITRLQGRGKYLRQTHPMMLIFGLVPITQEEAHVFVAQLKGWVMLAMKLILSYLLDLPQRLRSRRSRRSACGSAGVARLALSVEERNIPIWLKTEMTELIVENGRAVGIRVCKDGEEMTIQARKAVVLASGGFEHNQLMREKYLPEPTNKAWSAGHTGNTGTPIEKAMQHGAAVKAMEGGWWCTTIRVPGEDSPRLSIMEKSYPGSCVVNRQGKRIANESMNYQMYVQECFKAREKGIPIEELWMVFDARFRANYLVGPLMTSKLMPDMFLPKRFYAEEFLTKADNMEALAEKAGIDREGLAETIRNMNEYARTGVDDDFNRGGFAYDRYYGDPAITPNNCLAPIGKKPFYAIRLYLGDFGTNGGLVTTTDAQVVREDGRVFEGLYATGNCSAPVLPTYPGPGSTLGPAMTFAYQAAKHLNTYSD
ncbi:MAG: FAD-binding protein [Gammaproteobacteria bacterium]|nr:FAD-binding protein [Gammaproteobacteria bacterium]